MKDKILLGVAGILVVFAVFKPYLENMPVIDNNPSPTIIVGEITDEQKEQVKDIVESVKNGSQDRVFDGKHLASLYMNLSELISMDASDEIIKNTFDIKQANSLSGRLLKLDFAGKYGDASKLCTTYLKSQIGEEDVELTPELRAKAVESFKVLAWAFNEGAK